MSVCEFLHVDTSVGESQKRVSDLQELAVRVLSVGIGNETPQEQYKLLTAELPFLCQTSFFLL